MINYSLSKSMEVESLQGSWQVPLCIALAGFSSKNALLRFNASPHYERSSGGSDAWASIGKSEANLGQEFERA